MTPEEARALSNGVYVIRWKDNAGGGSSVASVGQMYDGTKWYLPSNWTTLATHEIKASTHWEPVARADRIVYAVDAVVERETAIDKAVERLVFMMHIYQGFPVGKSRGPNGCVWEAIKTLAPDIAAEVEQSDWKTVYNKHWAEFGHVVDGDGGLPPREEDDLPPPHRKPRTCLLHPNQCPVGCQAPRVEFASPSECGTANTEVMRGDFAAFAMALRDELADYKEDPTHPGRHLMRIVYDCAQRVARRAR